MDLKEDLIKLIILFAVSITIAVVLLIVLLRNQRKNTGIIKKPLNDLQKRKLSSSTRLRQFSDEEKKKLAGDKLKKEIKDFAFVYPLIVAFSIGEFLLRDIKLWIIILVYGVMLAVTILFFLIQYLFLVCGRYSISYGYCGGTGYIDHKEKGRYYYYDPSKDRYRSVVLLIPEDMTYIGVKKKDYYELVVYDYGIWYKPVLVLPKVMWEKPKRLGASFKLLNVQKAREENNLSVQTDISADSGNELIQAEYADEAAVADNESGNRRNDNVEVKPPWEGRMPLGEQPHYKMLNNLMHLTGRFNHLKREYYSGVSDEKELSEITTQPLLYSLVVGKKRLDRLGLKVDEEIIDSASDYSINSPQYNMKTVENDRDEYGIRSRLSFVKRKIYKGNKCIYKHKDKEISVISILRSRVKGDTACCPNCGYSGNISDFMTGCAACGASFTLHDFEPKITDYSLKQNEYLQIENIIDLWGTRIILGLFAVLIIGFPIWCFEMVLNALLNYPGWLEIIDNIFLYAMKTIMPLFGATTVLFLIVHVIRNRFKKSYGENTTGMDKVSRIFENNSFADFMQDMEYKLRNIHLADSPEQVDFYTKCSMKDIVPKYSDVISCDVVNLHFLEGRADIDTYYMKTRATARLIRYYRSRIHIQHELIDFDVSGRKKAIDKPIKAMREYKCPNCANSLNLFEGVTCRYCGETFDYADYDWMIESYDSKRKRYILPAAIKVIICVVLIVTAVVSIVV